MRLTRLLALCFAFLFSAVLNAATFTVNNAGDDPDNNTADNNCATAAAVCTLRAAIQQANVTAGADVINFNGPLVITRANGSWPDITQQVTIDGTSIPGYTRGVTMVVIDANNLGNGLTVAAGGGSSVIKGLVIQNASGDGISITANSVTVESCHIGTDVAGLADVGNDGNGISISGQTNVIGGLSTATGNVISGNVGVGIDISSVNSIANVIRYNMIGVNLPGLLELQNDSHGIRLTGSATLNVIAPLNVISGNGGPGIGHGVFIDGSGTDNNTITGNHIGTDLAAILAIPNNDDGVKISTNATGNRVGGLIIVERNVISGNGEDGVQITGGANGNLIQGNFIGTDVSGMLAIPNTRHGVFLNGASNTVESTVVAPQVISGNTQIGIRVFGANGNVIHRNLIGQDLTGGPLGNGADGVEVNSAIDTRISENDIRSNGGLGIDLLGSNGVDANDAGDGDAGANNLQNFPVLTAATSSGGTTTVTGTLNSTASTQFTIDFFSSVTADPSGNGEGEDYDSSTNVTTDGTGNAAFSVPLANNLAGGTFVTATARTVTGGSTSEFSVAIPVVVVLNADLQVTKTAAATVNAGANLAYTITMTNAGPDAAANVSLDDLVPANTTFVSLASPGGFACTTPAVGGTGNINCTAASLASGANAVFTLVVMVAPNTASGTTITNTATVATTTNDPNGANNSATHNGTVTTEADLAVTKTDAPDPVLAGNNITYTITVVNNGPSDAQGVQILDAVPANTTFVSLASAAGYSATTPPVGGTGNVTITKATVPAGANDVFTLVVAVDGGVAAGTTITNTANITATTTDPNAANNTATATTTTSALSANLGLTKTDAPDPVLAGSNITYTITLTNAGPDAASAVSITDNVPANTTFVSLTAAAGYAATTPAVGGTGLITITNPSVPNGANDQFTLVVAVDPGVAAGSTITNTATVTSTTADPVAGNNSATATTTTAAQADLSLTKTDAPDPVVAGSNITYTITLANAGPSAAANVSLTDNVPVNTTFVSLIAPAGYTTTTPAVGGTGAITANKASVPSGANDVFTLVVNVNGGVIAGTTITNTATVATATTDPVAGNNTASTTTTTSAVVLNADLGLTKTDAPDPVLAGSNITYTITLTNAGPDAATNVSIADTVPANTTFVSLTAAAGYTSITPPVGGTGAITITNASVANGANDVFTLVVNVNPGTAGGTIITNTATASTTSTDGTPANNSATATTTVNAPAADLSVASADAPDPVAAGANIVYTLTLQNGGPQNASTVTLAGNTPANTTFGSLVSPAGYTCTTPPAGGTGAITCSALTVLSGANDLFTLTVNVNGGTAGGTIISNTTTVSSATADPNPANDSATSTTTVAVAATSADLSVTKTDAPDPVVTGQQVTFTITVNNAGPDAASTVVISDPLPAGTTFQSCTPSVGTCTDPGVGVNGTVTVNIASLASGASAAITIVANVNAAGGATLTNTATASSATSDPNIANNSATSTTAVNAAPVLTAELMLTKSDAPDPVVVNTALVYTLTVRNNGPDTATAVVITDNLPASVTFNSASAGCAAVAQVVTCNIASILSGGTATVTIDVTPTATGIITNNASVTGAEADPVPANNATSAATTVNPVPLGNADLMITKSDAPDPVLVNTALVYSVTVRNNGPDAATAVVITDNLPASVTFNSASAGCAAVAQVVTCNIATIASGGTSTVTINVTPTAAGTITNNASVTAAEADPNAANNATSVTTTVVSSLSQIPTVSLLTLLLMGLALAAVGAWFVRTR